MPDVLLHGHLGSAGTEVENGFLVSIRVFGMVSGLVSGMVSGMVSGTVFGLVPKQIFLNEKKSEKFR